jgi:glucose-6-phosphate isomerase
MTLLAKQQVYPSALKKTYAAQLERAAKINLVSEIINKNPAVFKKKKKSHQKLILDRLGWIEVIKEMPGEIGRMESLAQAVRADGMRHVIVLGMGGSSLCPEVFGKLFGKKSWLKDFVIFDTTAPSQLKELIRTTDFEKAFFIVSSKSGTTVETMAQFRFFFRMVKDKRPLKVGRHFAAITDSGSKLHLMARRNRFREIFLNRSDIGDRYSALSYYGLVPGAFTKANLADLLNGAEERLAFMISHANNCDALKLGLLMGVGAGSGVDKLRFRTTDTVAPFITWIEQLVAESSGKEMKGIIPIEGSLDNGHDADDILDVFYSVRGERLTTGQSPEAAGRRNVPYVSIEIPDPVGIGGEMLKWEMATVVASTVLGVNPFDEPNVAESKKNAVAILHSPRGPRKVVPVIPLATYGEVDIIAASGIKGLERRRKVTPEDVFSGLLKGARKGDYVSILSYTERQPEIERRLKRLRQLIENKYGLITLRGYGPRFLHSTGQLFKGGSQKGHFIILEREYGTDYEIPGKNISFGRLIKAQAQGDVKSLRKRRRPVVNINLRRNPAAGLDQLIKLVDGL